MSILKMYLKHIFKYLFSRDKIYLLEKNADIKKIHGGKNIYVIQWRGMIEDNTRRKS